MADRGNEWIGTVAFGVGVGVAGAFWALAYTSKQLGAASIPIWVVALLGATAVMYSPLGRAVAARLHRTDDHADARELAEPLYAELDESRARMAELEERLDFAERLLSVREQPGVVPPLER